MLAILSHQYSFLVSKNDQIASSLDASWLEHMSDPFQKGMLVNALFHLGMTIDSLQSLTDTVFIFEAVCTEDSKSIQDHDAIIVEQRRVLECLEIQTDYLTPAELTGSLRLAAHLCATNSHCQDYQGREHIHQADCLSSETLTTSENQEGIKVSVAILLRRPAQKRKPKGKLGVRDKRLVEENENNIEDQLSKDRDVENCVLGRQQEHWAS